MEHFDVQNVLDVAEKADGFIFLFYGVWVVKMPREFKHPGGTKILEEVRAPKDCSKFFEIAHGGRGHSESARKSMKSFIIGYISEELPSYPVGTLPEVRKSSFSHIKTILGLILFMIVHLIAFYYASRKS